MKALFERLNLLVEPSGASAIAAVLYGADRLELAGKRGWRDSLGRQHRLAALSRPDHSGRSKSVDLTSGRRNQQPGSGAGTWPQRAAGTRRPRSTTLDHGRHRSPPSPSRLRPRSTTSTFTPSTATWPTDSRGPSGICSAGRPRSTGTSATGFPRSGRSLATTTFTPWAPIRRCSPTPDRSCAWRPTPASSDPSGCRQVAGRSLRLGRRRALRHGLHGPAPPPRHADADHASLHPGRHASAGGRAAGAGRPLRPGVRGQGSLLC